MATESRARRPIQKLVPETEKKPATLRLVTTLLGLGQVEVIARDAEAKGYRVSARQAYLRAVTYLRNAAMALQPSDPRYRPAIEKSRALFRKFAALSTPAVEVVEIPYEWTSLPGQFLRPDVQRTEAPNDRDR
jgi:hypothetical protein